MSTARPTPRCSARRSRSPASPATSRPRCSARPASTPGMAKNTYGTGCFMLMHTGDKLPVVEERPADHRPRRRPAPHPSTRWKAACSSAARWCSGCATGCGHPMPAARCRRWPTACPTAGGVIVVPAFTGLGAPYWEPDARGAIVGLTPRQHDGAHRARGAGEHRLPERGAAAGDEPRRDGCRRSAGGRIARRWRRLRQRPADAVPGRPAGHPGGAAARSSRRPRWAPPIWPAWRWACTRTPTRWRRSGRRNGASSRRCRAARAAELMAGWEHAVRQAAAA